MKKTIQIDEDLYNLILRNAQSIGEEASPILRRMLGIRTKNQGGVYRPNHQASSRSNGGIAGAVEELLNLPRFQAQREATGKFLVALWWLHGKHGRDFCRVSEIQGRRRRYFAQSADELERSGSSVGAQQIPGTDWWVVTNNDTPKKKRILTDVLHVLGYSSSDIGRLVSVFGQEKLSSIDVLMEE